MHSWERRCKELIATVGKVEWPDKKTELESDKNGTEMLFLDKGSQKSGDNIEWILA